MSDTDDILDTIGNAIQDYFPSVENVPGAMYIADGGKTYVVSVMECEECEEQ